VNDATSLLRLASCYTQLPVPYVLFYEANCSLHAVR